jgi:hypothetical protein
MYSFATSQPDANQSSELLNGEYQRCATSKRQGA